MARRFDTVGVWVDLESFDSPVPMGTLRRQSGGSGDVFSFEYDERWLQRREAFAFDPDLALASGAQYPAGDRSTFGIFLDSSPDRWGRKLMQRRENTRARAESRQPRMLTEWDFLLGVHDETRLGALRFRASADGPYIDSDRQVAAPPLTSLRELQAASRYLEEHEGDDDAEYVKWLSQLVAPGSSLGGARPKASVRDEAGALCLAKFPSRDDTHDVGAWELVAHRLAAKAGINVPATRALRLGDSNHTTFLAQRFDRTADDRRLAFVSAMTLTQRADGEGGASYLELVDLLQSRGVSTDADCAELFRRVVFSILIHNTDDHLRNHGFFIDAKGVALSPVFDINPSLQRRELTLAINENETACDVTIALEAHREYGLSGVEAEEIFRQVQTAVGTWREEAERLKIARGERELMASAFQV